MAQWDDLKNVFGQAADKAKGVFTKAADQTQKGAKIASLKVKAVMEENKINKAMLELGKKAYELLDKNEVSIKENSSIKEAMSVIKASKKTIADINTEISNLK